MTLALVGPFGAATGIAQTTNQTGGTIAGSIHDASGAPVSDVTVKIVGPSTQTTASDAQGNFRFGNVPPGIYAFSATKAGYTTATESSVAVLTGQTQTLNVAMNLITFSSLRTIAAVRSVGRGTFNTTPASVSVVSSQTFQDQAQPQVMKILSETPGIVASQPATSGNLAVPGAITFPNIRGALSFETASLVDGHPVSVGTFGDYVTSFLNPFMLQSVEIVKGPGADAPEVNYAIGGTVNFRTKDPTFKPSGMYQLGLDNHGSSMINFGFSDTVGRLGYVLAYSSNVLESGVSGARVFISPQSPQQGVLNFNGSTGTGVGFNDVFPTPTVPGTVSTVENSYNLVACCQTVNALYENVSELAKLRYKLSPVTFATFTYFGGQTHANQAANTGDISHAMLSMTPTQAAGYTGSIANNTPLDIGFVRTPEIEINNEPILEGDLRSTINNDTVLARYYAAGIHRLIFQGTGNPSNPTFMNLQLYGYDTATKRNYNGQTLPVAFFDFFNQAEDDALRGYSFEYDHPFNNGNDTLTFSYDSTHSTTTSYSVRLSGPRAGRPFNVANVHTFQVVTLPTGSAQTFGTGMLRGNFRLNTKTNVTFSNYFNTYRSTYPVACPSGSCTFDGTGFVFATGTRTHYDPRLAVEYRPDAQLALRLSAGSAISPPYLGLLANTSQPISYSPPSPIATQQVSPGNLQPETAFGYDVGGDYRFSDGVTFLSGDVYMENLFNHFVNLSVNSGQFCPITDPAGCPPNTPLIFNTWTNVSNARFEGIELALRRMPASGLGFVAQGALQKAYAYNLPPNFYCSNPIPVPPATTCTPDTNLGIIGGQNFTGGGIDGSVTTNGLSNQNIPYAQGYGELNYRTRNGWYANVNLTYFGKNNSLYRPPFTVLGATLRVPVKNGLSLQVSGDNLTNQYSDLWPVYGGGVTIPLANGQLAATQGNVLGPSVIRFFLTKSFGEGVTPTP